MTAHPTCTDASCERAVVRYRDGAGYCMFHPEAQPPVLDPKTGKFRTATKLAATLPPIDLSPHDMAAPRPARPRRAPVPAAVARDEKPTVADFDQLYADAVARVRAADASPPDDGICATEGCSRPWRHTGRHGVPRAPLPPAPADGVCTVVDCDRPWRHNGRHRQPRTAAPRPRPVRPVVPPPADGLCVHVGCTLPWRHKGRHMAPVDHTAAARRYSAGEGLFALAADLHISTKRLRSILREQCVELRKRGEVIGRRGPEPLPIDVGECKRLYTGGMDARSIAEQMHVKARRVYDVLRAEGVLGPPGGREPGPGALNAVRLKLTREESVAVRGRAASLGLSINAYLRGVVLADVAPSDEAGAA